MNHHESTFGGSGGLDLYYQSWLPQTESNAIVAIVHGFGEHSGRYQNIVQHLVPLGYGIYGFDNRGHGRSPGRRGHIDSWREYHDDVAAFLTFIRKSGPSKPLFLLGHSMGTLIVLENWWAREEFAHPTKTNGVLK